MPEVFKFFFGLNEDAKRAFERILGVRHAATAYFRFDESDIQQPLQILEDIDSIVAKLKTNGIEIFSEIQNYEDIYKLCYCRGPEGIIIELVEESNFFLISPDRVFNISSITSYWALTDEKA